MINAGNTLHTSIATPNGGRKRSKNPLVARKQFICPKENGRKKKQNWGRYSLTEEETRFSDEKADTQREKNIRLGKHSGIHLRRGTAEQMLRPIPETAFAKV